MASEPQFLPPPSDPAPLSPVPVDKPATPRRRMGMLGIVVISALVGALAGTAATILVAPRLIKVTPTTVGGGGIGPLAPVTNNVTEESAVISVADQEKRAFILKSEGQQQSQINIADGQKQAQIKTAEGDKQSAILRAEGLRQATILEAEGRAQAVETVYKAIKDAAPDPILVSILQLDTLSKFANSENAKLVVPVETAGLLGAAQALRSVLDGVPTAAKP